MNTFFKYRAGLSFVGGVVAGLVILAVALRLGGFAVVGQGELDEQRQEILTLQAENQELIDDLFRFQGTDAIFSSADLPYQHDVDAREAIAAARIEAQESGRFLMITFGANWCLDCRTLHHRLQDDEVAAYTRDRFVFVNVDVGKFNRNRDVAADLGVDLSRGIPVGIFFDPEGGVIGTKNDGELEPARYYTSKQILKFVRDIVDKALIAPPDSVR